MNKIHGLYAIIDNLELAHMMLMGGCKILQLRIKSANFTWNDEAFEISKKIMILKKKYDFTFIVNDYVDVAGEIGSDGLHLGDKDTPIEEARKRLKKGTIIGYSSHSINEAKAAARRGADYVAFGAIFPTKTKGPGHPVQGIDKLKKLVNSINVPVVAIGGINRTNIDSVINTGVSATAMITGLTQAKNIVEETKWYIEKWQRVLP